MAIRTTSTLVIELLGRNYDKKTGLDGYIKSANVLTNNLVNLAQAKGVTLDADTLERIECNLACHFYQRHDPGFQQKTTGRASAGFLGQATLRFSSTMYGQDAMSLDFSGCLASLEKGGRQSLVWLGKPVSQQVPYIERN